MRALARFALALCILAPCVLAPGLPVARAAEIGTVSSSATAPAASVALERLLDGNRRFVAGASTHRNRSAAYRAGLVSSQHPFATILGCSDSRVPIEMVFDRGFGDLFIVRVAGNLVGESELGSIEYAVDHLHTPLVVVLGHEGCGAVSAALMSAEERSHESRGVQELLDRIEPALSGLDPGLSPAERVQQGVEANVRQSVRQLEASTDLMTPHEGAAPMIVGAVYDLETGKVRLLK